MDRNQPHRFGRIVLLHIIDGLHVTVHVVAIDLVIAEIGSNQLARHLVVSHSVDLARHDRTADEFRFLEFGVFGIDLHHVRSDLVILIPEHRIDIEQDHRVRGNGHQRIADRLEVIAEDLYPAIPLDQPVEGISSRCSDRIPPQRVRCRNPGLERIELHGIASQRIRSKRVPEQRIQRGKSPSLPQGVGDQRIESRRRKLAFQDRLPGFGTPLGPDFLHTFGTAHQVLSAQCLLLLFRSVELGSSPSLTCFGDLRQLLLAGRCRLRLFHGRYAVGLCPQLSFQAVGLGFPLPLGKNMHGRIRRKRFWTGLRKAVGKKRIHRRNGGHGIGRGHSAPHPIKAVGKKRIYCWGGIQRIAPRSSFFNRNSRYRFCNGTRTGIRSFGRGFDGSGRSLRSSGIRLRSILRGFWTRSTRFRSQ